MRLVIAKYAPKKLSTKRKENVFTIKDICVERLFDIDSRVCQ